MRRLAFIIQKEFIQIFRNKAMLPLITVVPIVQLIVLSFAADNEVRNVRLAIVDQDRSVYSQRIIEKIRVSDRFVLVDAPPTLRLADALMQRGKVDVILTIPPDFERTFWKSKRGSLQLLVNAINGQQATVGAAYLGAILGRFNREIRLELFAGNSMKSATPIPSLQTTTRYWYNETLNYQHFMAPGICGELVTILVMLLTAMNVVREREIGTIDQINVTPIRKWEFILGKMVPFLVIGLALLTVGLSAAKLIFDIPMRGSLALIFGYCLLNVTAVLGLGLFISNLSDTQQQAMFTTFFFVIIFILMSGLFTPIESMPKWAQYLTIPNPIAHFVHVMRSVLLKGSGFFEIAPSFYMTAGLAVVTNTLAVLSYRKVV